MQQTSFLQRHVRLMGHVCCNRPFLQSTCAFWVVPVAAAHVPALVCLGVLTSICSHTYTLFCLMQVRARAHAACTHAHTCTHIHLRAHTHTHTHARTWDIDTHMNASTHRHAGTRHVHASVLMRHLRAHVPLSQSRHMLTHVSFSQSRHMLTLTPTPTPTPPPATRRSLFPRTAAPTQTT